MIQATLKQMTTQHNQRRLLLLIAAVSCFMLSQAQSPVKGSPGRPALKSPSTYSTLQDTGKRVDIREKLVQLAMQNPNYEIADRNVAIANDQLKKSKGSWLGIVSAQGNLNEFSLNPPPTINGTAVSLYPRYNVGVTVPLDLFSSKRNDIKIARQQLGVAQAQKNERFREIKAEVLTVYEDYLLYKQQLEYQSQIVQDAESVYRQAEKDFSEGIIKQEDYNNAFKARSQEKTMFAQIQHSYNISKIQLEKLIGVPIESVLNN
jgi:outer membrane protein TolC